MLDIRCIYDDTITLHDSATHHVIVIGDEIGRAQQYADHQDIIMRYDESLTDYGSLTISAHDTHLQMTYGDHIIIYDKWITDQTTIESCDTYLMNIADGREHHISLLQSLKPTHIIILPTIDQQLAINCASQCMRAGLSVPKFFKEGQYMSI